MKNRHGSYKKIMLLESSMESSRDYLQKNIDALRAAPLSPFTFCTLYILLFLRLRHSKNWLQKKSTAPLTLSKGQPLLDFIPVSFNLSAWEKEKLKGITAEELFKIYNLRGIPEAVSRTMINWSEGKWNIELMTRIPSPRELLKLQVHKTRCITLMVLPKDIDQLVLSARDPLSFVLHDLLHADHFFSEEESLKGQLGFYSLINKVYDRPELKKTLRNDGQFKSEFEYVVSDMNAYVIHLFKCLKSAFLRTDIRSEQSLFQELLKWWDMPMEVTMAAHKLNTPDFTYEDEIHLKNFFEKHQEVMA